MPKVVKRTLIEDIGLAAQVYQRSTDAFDDAVANALKLNRTDLRCLDLLFGGPASAGELAAATGVSLSATTTMLDRLQKRNFVRRVPDSVDRRKVLVEMTEEGLAAAGRFYGPLAQEGAAQLMSFNTAELEAIKAHLIQSRHLIEKHRQCIDGEDPAE
jgi:DNA-binding MarR family transcriptional regulator